ncbi:hypothetical protein COO60DRAFT_333006 [Scenedesmus sp. NREL 46B-D3]|nr:hypothetical protein COO60DRAFT_333006 [Scenedesmus sp. NREL 46B-D3]
MLMTCSYMLLSASAAGTLGCLLLSQGLNKRTVTTLLLSLALATSQAVLASRNTGSLSAGLPGLQQLLSGWGGSGSLHQQQPQQPQQLPVAASRTKLQVQGMRCEACAARLRGNLAAVEGVDSCTVQLAAGVVDVWSNSSSPVQPSVLLDAVKATDDSYKVQLLSRECFDAAEGALPCPAVAAAAASQDAAVAH